MEVTNEEFFAFVGGRANAEVKRRIVAELDDSNSNVRRLLAKFDAVSQRPFDVSWRHLLTTKDHNGGQKEVTATKVPGQENAAD